MVKEKQEDYLPLTSMSQVDDLQSKIWLPLCSRAYVRAMAHIQRHRAQLERDIKDGVLPKTYGFWHQNSTHLRVLHLLMEAHYDGKKISKSAIAIDMNITRPNVTRIFKEARELNLLDENDRPTGVTLEVAEEAMRRVLINYDLMRFFTEFVSRATIARLRFSEEQIQGKLFK